MKKFFAQYALVRKILVTFGIVSIFLLGRKIPLPQVLTPLVATGSILEEGGSQISLFSLGMGPSMYGMLLNHLWTARKKGRSVSPKLMAVRQYTLVLMIAILQGVGLSIRLSHHPFQGAQLVLIVVAGAFIIHWLGQLNLIAGIGGYTWFILISMLTDQFHMPTTVKVLWQSNARGLLVCFLIWVLVAILVITVCDRAEYRIPIERMSIHNAYSEQAYLPIRVNVSRGMSLMYAYSFVRIPSYILFFFSKLFQKWSWLERGSSWLDPRSVSGVFFYLFMIFVFTYLLAFVNLDLSRLTEDLRKTGDYIPRIRSGKDTKSYLFKYLTFFAGLNSLLMVVLVGIPMLVGLLSPAIAPLASSIGVVIMMVGMFLQIREEIAVLALRKEYQSLFD